MTDACSAPRYMDGFTGERLMRCRDFHSSNFRVFHVNASHAHAVALLQVMVVYID